MKKEFRHPYQCPVCFDGTIEKELWEMLYGKNVGMTTCGHSSKRLNELKIWIGNKLDAIDFHGCANCWSDCRGCSCKKEKDEMKKDFLIELAKRLDETIS